MATEMKDLRKELEMLKYENDLLQKISCTKQENKAYEQLLAKGETLPVDIVSLYEGAQAPSEFCRVCRTDLTEAEIREYLAFKKLGYLRTIKNSVVFFTVLTVIGMVAAFLLTMGMI